MLCTPLLHLRQLAVAPRFRPRRPAALLRLVCPPLQLYAVVGGLITQAIAAFTHKGRPGLMLFALAVSRLKVRPGVPQRSELKRHYSLIVNQLRFTRFGQCLPGSGAFPPLLCRRALLKIGDLTDVDIDYVQPAARRRAVRTGETGAGGIERMQRIQPDEIATALSQLHQQLVEIAEVADAPVLFRAHGVELHQRTPAFFPRLQRRRQIAAARRDDNPRLPAFFALTECELVVPLRQRARQRKRLTGG